MIKVKVGLLLIALVLIIAAEQASAVAGTRSGLPDLPSDWQVTAAILADVTGDGSDEWVLVVWRPWRDWPIQQWSDLPSPIAGFHDPVGDSCHLILLDPEDGREIWAGSALPVPILSLAIDDADGDGVNEVWAVEGRYADGRNGLGTHVDVWRWNGFGFTLTWRSAFGDFAPSCLASAGRCGVQEMSE
ncbi:MAG: hypothetical protein JW934_09705 [Anaerolineae bacterium]|nr:hypothetical protein [Anaerolineae bacterium]